MAFIRANFQKISASLNDFEPRGWSYSSKTDDITTIRTAGYFNELIDEINIGDFLYIRGSDYAELVRFGPLDGSNDLTILNPSPNYINLPVQFDTSASGLETFEFPMPLRGTAISGSLCAVTGTGPGESFSFDLVNPGFGAVLTLSFGQNHSVGFTVSAAATANKLLIQDQLVFWQKNSGNFVQTFIGNVIIDID